MGATRSPGYRGCCVNLNLTGQLAGFYQSVGSYHLEDITANLGNLKVLPR